MYFWQSESIKLITPILQYMYWNIVKVVLSTHKSHTTRIYDRLRSASGLQSASTDVTISNLHPFQILRSVANLLVRVRAMAYIIGHRFLRKWEPTIDLRFGHRFEYWKKDIDFRIGRWFENLKKGCRFEVQISVT